MQDVPVKKGDVHTVNITDQGAKGDGVTRIKGFVVIVPDTKKGDTVEIEITRVTSKLAFAKIAGSKSVSRNRFVEFSLDDMPEEKKVEYTDTDDFGEDLDEE